MNVPVIDISAWRAGSALERVAIAAEVDAACRDSGFFQVVGHGVSRDLIEDALAAIDEFFDLPLATKMAVSPTAADINRGFLPLGSEALSYTVGVDTPTDLREAFVIGPDDVPNDAVHRHAPFRVFEPNLWPDHPTSLRPLLNAYFAAVADVAHCLTDIYALALGLGDGYFRPSLGHSTETLRVNFYECVTAEAAIAGQQRLGAHTDYGITTVLFADRVPGLQLLAANGGWHDVLSEPDAFVVNLGDLLAQWTNDRWRSTVHRVVDHRQLRVRRRSIAFFLDGNYDAVVQCLPTCCDESHPAKYPPTTAGEHLAEKLRGARTLTKSAAIDTVGERIHSLRDS